MFVLSVMKCFFRKPYMKRLDKPTKRVAGKIAKHKANHADTSQKTRFPQVNYMFGKQTIIFLFNCPIQLERKTK
jgi:hypothetical protein